MFFNEMGYKMVQIPQPFAQGNDEDVYHIEPEKQVFPELSFGCALFEILVGGGNDSDIENIFSKYADHITAYVDNKRKLEDKDRNIWVLPDEKFMRSIEKEMGVPESREREYRDNIVKAMGLKARKKEVFDYKSDENLYNGLKRFLYKKVKDTIKLASLRTGVVNPEEQEKIDVVVKRLKKDFGYCDHCSKMMLAHVASVFERGDE